MHSYHIFYFPFRWDLPSKGNLLFSEQVDINRVKNSIFSQWERCQLSSKEEIFHDIKSKECVEMQEVFAEQQYYFDFVHPVLYDMKDLKHNLLHHYERKEFKNKNHGIEYHIESKSKIYTLSVEAIDLNLYTTGIGILSFYMANNRDDQKDELSVRNINQFGRRIMPPHPGEFDKEKRSMLAKRISIIGLVHPNTDRYSDSFDYNINRSAKAWTPSTLISALIEDLNSDLQIVPVIDDRMFVNCTYINKELSTEVAKPKSNFIDCDFWYKYVFIDNDNDLSCQNKKMRDDLINESSYLRWEKYGTIYGISRYSLVTLANSDFIVTHMRTIYSRMFELAIVQRASILRFSGEVTKVSSLKSTNNKDVANRISSLYKEYIRFINQIYFRSITSQDQGIEIYGYMMKQLECENHSKELDSEIRELHNYVTLLIEQRKSENSEFLNIVAAIFLPATILTGIFGMNAFPKCCNIYDMITQIGIGGVISTIVYIILTKWRNKNV